MTTIDLIIPPRTPPVTPNKVMIAQFMPSVAGAVGSPKQVAQAWEISGFISRTDNMRMIFILVFIFRSA